MSIVTLDTTHGNIVIELNEDKAPETVKNFISYVNDGYYDGTIFHRVIPNFMIQGGGFMPGMVQKRPEDPIKNEADNGLTNDRGTIAMARTNDPHSASAQFFINHKDNGFLNHTAPTDSGWGYCVFGKVTDGMDTVDAIAAVSTGNDSGHSDVPVENVIINKASVS
jgi:peptidyl-prolyl cis-trans isomerase B (cyclophilin B)